MELLGGIEQRLGGNAADVEARAAECGLAVAADPRVDACGFKPELRGANCRVISGGAAADDDDVEVVHCNNSLLSSSFRRKPESSAFALLTIQQQSRRIPARAGMAAKITFRAACAAGSQAD